MVRKLVAINDKLLSYIKEGPLALKGNDGKPAIWDIIPAFICQ